VRIEAEQVAPLQVRDASLGDEAADVPDADAKVVGDVVDVHESWEAGGVHGSRRTSRSVGVARATPRRRGVRSALGLRRVRLRVHDDDRLSFREFAYDKPDPRSAIRPGSSDTRRAAVRESPVAFVSVLRAVRGRLSATGEGALSRERGAIHCAFWSHCGPTNRGQRWSTVVTGGQLGSASDQLNSQVRGHDQGCPRQDSNLRTRLRRPMLYPLSYEGGMR
jgi:hypothetical protein